MSGSKVGYTFVIDFLRLYGDTKQLPSAETWDAMTLCEQQDFVSAMVTHFTAPAGMTSVDVASEAAIDPPLAYVNPTTPDFASIVDSVTTSSVSADPVLESITPGLVEVEQSQVPATAE